MNSIYQSLLQAKIDRLKPGLASEFERLEIEKENEQRKNSYAFLIFSLMSICDIDLNEAVLCSTEGGDDLKIDGFYIDTAKNGELQVHIFQTKYRENINNGIGKNEIEETISSVEKIINGEIPATRINARIRAKINELQDAIKEFGAIPNINVYFVINGKLPVENDKEQVRKFGEKENRQVYFYSTEEIFSVINETQKKDYKVSITTKGDIAMYELDTSVTPLGKI